MSQRNPYAAPTAPVIAADEPTRLPTDPDQLEYGGFWRRVGAILLDWIFMIPLGVLLAILMFSTSRAYLYFAIPNIAISLFYFVYLVKRFGGTPGKLISHMRITMVDGSPVTTRAAVLRYLPFFIPQALSLLLMAYATLSPVPGYDSMNIIEKMQSMQRGTVGWNGALTGVTYVWWIATAITLAVNQRKRAAHDFLAGTVVLRTD
jgi:uncharacterized RDD family membrane protein YckC